MKSVQDRDAVYDFFHPYINWMFRWSYRHIQYIGRENIPTDGAIIFAPNHTNALCDAIAVLSIDNERKVFVARADIFRNPKLAKILRWFKILPIRRMRDGLDEVRHNDDTINQAIATLRDGVPFCILPEGTHRPKHSLLPLSKGIFRIALRANQEFGDEKPIYIVPVGLEYGDYFHLWDTLTVQIGRPIHVTQFVHAHQELDQPKLILALREELTLRMRKLILWVPDDEHYEENFQRLQENPPAPFNRWSKHHLPKWLTIAFLILLAPLFVVSAIVTLPLWILCLIIRHTIKDAAFHNSVQYFAHVFLLPLMLFVQMPFWMFFQEYIYQIRKL